MEHTRPALSWWDRGTTKWGRLKRLVLVARTIRVTKVPAKAVVAATVLTLIFAPIAWALESEVVSNTSFPAAGISAVEIGERQREAVRARPELRALRERSRSAFSDLGRADAMLLSKQAFAQMREPLWRAPTVDDEVGRRYLSDHVVALREAGEQREDLFYSTSPIRTPATAGKRQRPVSIVWKRTGEGARANRSARAVRGRG